MRRTNRFTTTMIALVISYACWTMPLHAKEKQLTAEQRGALAVWHVYSPLAFSEKAYDNLWKQWGLKEKPEDYERAVRKRYGLHKAPFDNQGMPLGLHRTKMIFGKGISTDCLLCHASSINGETVIGLGNSSIDIQSLTTDLAAGDFTGAKLPFKFGNVRGTIEALAGVLYLLQHRDKDLNLQQSINLELPQELCNDIPAWWQFSRKKTTSPAGIADVRSVRRLMSFAISPTNSAEFIKKQEPKYRDIHAYLSSLKAPKYPWPIDQKKVALGQSIFKKTCAKCHGTYGPDGEYPNRVVPLKIIGTDPDVAKPLPQKTIEHLKSNWLFQDKGPKGESYFKWEGHGGYQAPPLDGVWATAPYLHNGSLPTIYHVLNSKARPKIFTRSYRTDEKDYDMKRLGWKIKVLNKSPGPKMSGWERRKIYDTTQPGRGNSGHDFGDHLTDEQRMALIEYLKTL